MATEDAAPAKACIDYGEWTYRVDRDIPPGRKVWFSIFAGPMSGGNFISPRVAREIGAALIAHAEYAERVNTQEAA